MAGDWIKVEHVTPDKPEVHGIAIALNIDPDAVFGKLMRLWIWADQHVTISSRKCHALSVTEIVIDRVTCHAGFAQAMRNVGWLSGENGAISLPNFERHNGQTAKDRALAAKRKVTQRSRSQRDKSVTREEKRREENNSSSSAAAAFVLLRKWAEQFVASGKTDRPVQAILNSLKAKPEEWGCQLVDGVWQPPQDSNESIADQCKRLFGGAA